MIYFRDNKAGSILVLKEHLGLQSDQEAGVIWDQLHNTFGAEVPKDLFREIFEARRQTMIAANQWPKDKPLPDPEQFLARDLLGLDAEADGLRSDQARRTEQLMRNRARAGDDRFDRSCTRNQ